MKNIKKIIFSFVFLIFIAGCASTGEMEVSNNDNNIPKANQRLEKIIQEYGGYDDLVARGFDIHELDYVKNEFELWDILEPYFFQEDKGPIDKHFCTGIFTDDHHYSIKFENKYGTKEELLAEGYIENETMFYYPSHGTKDWRVGHFEWEIFTLKDFSNFNHEYYETEKSIIYKIKEMEKGKEIPAVSKAKKKENIILDLRENRGGYYSVIFNFINSLGKYDGKIVLLVDKQTASCGEATFFFLKQVPAYDNNGKVISYKETNYNVYIIGENTNGCLMFNAAEKLDKIEELGVKLMTVPKTSSWGNGISLDYDYGKTFKEGVGIMPDAWAMTEREYIKTVQWYTGDNEITYLIKN